MKMQMINHILPVIQSVSELFNKAEFKIPSYQRGYSWETDQVEDLCDDLDDVIQENGRNRNHFFGQIVTFNADDSDYEDIIDGQQRLTTSQLMLAVIEQKAKFLYESLKDTPSSSSGDAYDIYRDIRKSLDDGNKLVIEKSNSEANNERVFKALIQRGEYNFPIENKTKPIKNMENAYHQIDQWIDQKLTKKNLSEQVATLQEIADAFGNSFYFVKIFAPNRQDAFTIFETLNSRGKDLTSSDIIKSHLLSLLSNQPTVSEEANNDWNHIATILDENSEKINSFIRSYWAAKEQLVKSKDLYREVSKKINNTDDAKEFLNELNQLINLYSYLSTIGTSAYRKENSKNPYLGTSAAEGFNILGKLKFTLYYPIILAMYHNHFDAQSVRIVMNKIISVFMRFRFIAGRTTNKLEGGLSHIAVKIWRLQYQNVTEIDAALDALVTSTMSQSSIKAVFQQLSKEGGYKGAKKWGLTYLFSRLYDNDFENFEQSYNSVIEHDNYSLMHISGNNDVNPDHQNYIGNWTIVEKSLVDSIDNKDLATSYQLLRRSKLNSNQLIANRIQNNQMRWDEKDIEIRQSELANPAIEIWN